MKISIKDFISKSDQIRSFLLIWSHLLKKFLMENNFIFYAVLINRSIFPKVTEEAVAIAPNKTAKDRNRLLVL